MMPQLIDNTEFKADSANFLYNNENDEFLTEFQFILTELKKSVNNDRYTKVPDLIEPQ